MKKKGIIICSIIGVALIAVGITLLLLAPKKSNKEMFTEAIQKSLGLGIDLDDEKVENTIGELKEIIENNIYKITINSKVTEDEAGYSTSDDVIYFGKNQLYLKSESVLNDKTINLEGMLKDNKFYIDFEDVLDKVYYIDKIDELLNTSSSNGDSEFANKILTYLGDSFMDAIQNDQVKTESADLTINGKQYKAKKYGYSFTGNTLYEIVVSFVEKIKKDDSIYTELKKILETTDFSIEGLGNVELTKEMYDQILEQLPEYAKQLKTMGDLATINVYLYDNEPISRQITINMDTEQGKIPMTIADYTVDKYYKAAVSTMGMEVYKLEVKEQSANNSTISLYMLDQELLTGYINKNNDNYELKLETAGNLSGNSLLLKINKDGTGSLNVKTEYTEANLEYKVEKVDKIPEMDVTGSVSIEEMSDEEKERLEEFMRMFNPISAYSKKAIMESHSTNCVMNADGEMECLDM